MSLLDALHISGSGAKAQALRLELSASNVANAGTIAGSEATAYRSKHAVFENMVMDSSIGDKVSVSQITHSNAPVEKEYAPNHPLADQQGYIYHSNVNRMEEIADVMTANDSYQANLEMVGSVNKLFQNTIKMLGNI